MSAGLGTLESVFTSTFARRKPGGAARNVLWYALGLVALSAVSYTIPRIGVATTATLIVVAQLVTAALLDHCGLLGATVRVFDPARLLGIVVLFAGTWPIMR